MKIGVKVKNDLLILDNLGEFARKSLIDALWMANQLGRYGIFPEYYDTEVDATTLAEIDPEEHIDGIKVAQEISRIWNMYKSFVLL